ncbi:glucagon-like peptide 1 receptor [Pelobates cultripes]|uniref:Glucagon-like peptide 1 receptor n=1 Tax=Pelobates cultripes TaxID=61616 RepID=A0AAD1VQW0_PELCU|nr:glucagon-like peptide 1 receptor [Pelobates cultripes]
MAPNKRLCDHTGVPMLFVIPWGIVKYLYEDDGCWTRNYNMNYWLIIRLPILIAIGVNFVIFIRVICIIISKLQANLMCRTDTKCRLAKSTLTLIPLLGTHEIIFAFITDEHAKGIIRYIKLFFELSFSSFQGLMVAVLYCFINNEGLPMVDQHVEDLKKVCEKLQQMLTHKSSFEKKHADRRSLGFEHFAIHSYGTNFATKMTIFREPFHETFHNVTAHQSGTIRTFRYITVYVV